MAPPNGNNVPNHGEREMKRGLTVMKEVDRARSRNVKFDVGWNSKGQPINPNKSKFASYIGVVTRRSVPIRYDCWRSVAEEYKEKIWKDVASAFNVDESHRKFVLGEAGKLLRSFRAYLTRECLRDADGNINEHPPKIYANIISEDDWKAFVASRVDNSFQKLSNENRQRASNPTYPYRKSRLGYSLLEQNMLDEAGPQVNSISRHALWKAARLNKKGEIEHEAVRKVWDNCEALLQSGSQEEKQDSGHVDILTRALNAPEHPGRVRGLGYGVTQRDYFPPQKRSKQDYSNEMQSLREQLDTLKHDVLLLHNQMQMQMHKEVEMNGKLAGSSSEDSCSLASTLPLELSTQSKGKNKEIKELRQTKELITTPSKDPPKSALPTFPKHGVDNQLDRLSPSCKLLDRYARKLLMGGDQLTVDMEKDIFNFGYQEMIGQEQINELLHQKQIGVSVVSIYIRYLYHTWLVPKQMSSRFSFLCPHKMALPSTNILDYKYEHFKKSEYIAEVLIANEKRKKVFLAPYNTGEHWVLIAINADAKTVYYLDPMHSDFENHSEMKRLFNFALIIYHSGDHNIKWIQIKCPCQTNNKDSGYSVLRFMRDIIVHNESTIPETYFSDCRCDFYSQDQIDEIRAEWSSYVFDSCT